MALTYINKLYLGNYIVLREMHFDSTSIYILKNNIGEKIVFKIPSTDSKNTEKKLLYLDNISNLPITYPKYIYKPKDELSGYVMDYLGEDATNILYEYTEEEKINFLLKVKNKLEILHQNGIIHGNIKTSNILTPNNPIFCDLDDCIIKEENLYMEKPNILYQNYLDRTQTVDENLDKYEFNVMCYCVLNNIRSPFLIEHRIKNSIEKNDFGYFKDKESIKIIKRLITFKDHYPDEYLINN